ncbi:MAG TPA: ABC transporter substrate-binding protein [Trueperaceae bacterium]
MKHALVFPFRTVVVAVTMLLLAVPVARAQDPDIRVALGDIESVETLNLFVALERVRERGVTVELIELTSEDLATQAVVNGQADVGIGAPYALIQRVNAPIRIFYQLQTLRFFPVVNAEKYPDWQALDGQPFAVHSRGSGTEAAAHYIEAVEGIEFSEISFVPGSEVRATALLRGNIDATFLDIPNRNFVMEQAPGQFHSLPMPDIDASDEALFANVEWLENNQEAVQVLLEELLSTWRELNEDPSFLMEERERLGLLQDLPAELEEEILPYYEAGVEANIFPTDGGGRNAAESDFDFYTKSGQLEGDPESLAVEDFWYLAPLETLLESMGG